MKRERERERWRRRIGEPNDSKEKSVRKGGES